jgi:hypothetical protein
MNSPRRITSHRGIALPLAVFALVVVGALVAGAFFVGRQEQAVGRSSVKLQQAFAAAEAGAQHTVADWAADRYNGLVTGDSAEFSGTVGSAGWYRGTVRRLNRELFLVRSEGFSRDSAARQHVGLLVRLRPLELPVRSALSAAGTVRLDGAPIVDGRDAPPAGWSCDSAGPPVAGLTVSSPGAVTGGGCGGGSCLTGTPAVRIDSTLRAPAATRFGDLDFPGLRGLATVTLPGGTVYAGPEVRNGGCDRRLSTNWGSPLDPTGPCGAHFPVVWSDGDLTVSGVEGQGVLIVDGNLTLQGTFAFHGPVIVRGRLTLAGAGARIVGGALAGSADLSSNGGSGGPAVVYSRCATDRSLGSSATATLLRERSWVNLY